MNVREELLKQYKEVNSKLNRTGELSDNWAILQVAKAQILTGLSKYGTVLSDKQ